MRHFQRLYLNQHAAAFVGQPQLAVLHGGGQLHAALAQAGQFGQGGGADAVDAELVQLHQLVFDLRPPYFAGAAAMAVQHHLVGTAAGFFQAFFIRFAQLDPQFDFVTVILLPQLGFVVRAKATGEAQGFAGVQHKGHQAHHQALHGFRRVLGQGQVVAGIVAAVHVGNRQAGFINGGSKRHGDVSAILG